MNENVRNSIKRIKKTTFDFIVTNARSLAPKIESVITAFNELDLHFAVIAESWLKECKNLSDDLDDLNDGENISIIHKSRKSRRGKNAGGGIAILFQKNKIRLSERKIRRGKCELVCATGKLPGVARKIVILGAYLPPNIKANQAHEALAYISDAIGIIKQEMNDLSLIHI